MGCAVNLVLVTTDGSPYLTLILFTRRISRRQLPLRLTWP